MNKVRVVPLSSTARTQAVPLSVWLMAARPRTLGLSVSPVVVGAAVAWAAQQSLRWPAVVAALLGSMCIQLGTNLHNDAADSERGADGPDRIGPPRVTAMGLLDARSVKSAAALCFGLAAAMGLYLVAVGGWPILLLGLLSILAGWAYSGGPRPISYTPFGEAFVALFFGVGAVSGTYWLCAQSLSAAAATAGLALGLVSSAVLLVNNHRDREADARVGRRTFAIVAGPGGSATLYAALLLLPFALLVPIDRALPDHPLWLTLGILPPTVWLIHCFAHATTGRDLNRLLVQTVQLQLLFSALLAAGLLI
jgi:1,4-dihydroxy-2-naphthoate polyprenyltransferase